MASLADTILFGTQAAVEQYLQRDIDINEIDEYGFTPLIESIIANRPEITELLLKNGADVNEPDLTGSYPLHWAIENNNPTIAKHLLLHKADPNVYNSANQPVLVKALMRDHQALKRLLYQYGADLNFGQDYINTKLLGHRFELHEQVDIVTPRGKFIELEFAGFFLEFTLGVIQYSFRNFLNNFAARDFRECYVNLTPVLQALNTANEIIHYQQYLLNFEKYDHHLKTFLKQDPLIIPITYEGHAICFVKSGNWLAKCDRGENSRIESAVTLYQIGNLQAFTPDLLKNLIFKRQNKEIIHQRLNQYLQLEKIGELPIQSQVIGNCSWANVEATLPALFFMQLIQHNPIINPAEALPLALQFYEAWQNWDKDIALNECIQSFWLANPARKASKAALLGAILFQACDVGNPIGESRARRILPVLTTPEYSYVLTSYLRVYYKKYNTPQGRQLLALLRTMDIHVADYIS